MTIQQIIDWVSTAYPSSSDFTDSQKILDLDDIHKEIYMELGNLDNNYTVAESLTVIDQLIYMLPDDCRCDNIVKLKLSDIVTIDESTTWKTIEYAVLDQDISQGYYWTKVPPNKISLTLDGKAIGTMDLTLRVFYKRLPTTLTAVTDIPDLDVPYHNLLKYELVSTLAAKGNYGDRDIGNFYHSKYLEFYNIVKKDYIKRRDNCPTLTRGITRVRGW